MADVISGLLVLVGSFVLSFVIGIIGTLAGVGGGVLFTPIMLGFTSIHPDLVRSAGLAIACYSSIMAGTVYFRQRIAPFRLILLASTVLLPAAIIGAQLGIYVAALGTWGQGLIRASLGILLFLIVVLLSVKRVDWPTPRCNSRLIDVFGLRYVYHEKTLNRDVEYCPTGLGLAAGLPLLFLVGFSSGFFGLGAAWALIPIYNLLMNLPLKVAAASAKASLAFADTGALWGYILHERFHPELFIGATLGVIIGANLGAKLLLIARVNFVRRLILAIMIFNGIQLINRGLFEMGIIPHRLF